MLTTSPRMCLTAHACLPRTRLAFNAPGQAIRVASTGRCVALENDVVITWPVIAGCLPAASGIRRRSRMLSVSGLFFQREGSPIRWCSAPGGGRYRKSECRILSPLLPAPCCALPSARQPYAGTRSRHQRVIHFESGNRVWIFRRFIFTKQRLDFIAAQCTFLFALLHTHGLFAPRNTAEQVNSLEHRYPSVAGR